MIYHARNRKRRNATTLVETAIVISVCLLFLFGIVEYGRFLMIQHLINNAAREGARNDQRLGQRRNTPLCAIRAP